MNRPGQARRMAKIASVGSAEHLSGRYVSRFLSIKDEARQIRPKCDLARRIAATRAHRICGVAFAGQLGKMRDRNVP
ncbi:hypothetical protein [Nevskia sp.]|uniref:hypothetical protein n=1 Tax=Nevskia sp. TaxID=1929292 RepID=UPI0025F6BE85|nr:hypothetical protein [Nevskia sp.]